MYDYLIKEKYYWRWLLKGNIKITGLFFIYAVLLHMTVYTSFLELYNIMRTTRSLEVIIIAKDDVNPKRLEQLILDNYHPSLIQAIPYDVLPQTLRGLEIYYDKELIPQPVQSFLLIFIRPYNITPFKHNDTTIDLLKNEPWIAQVLDGGLEHNHALIYLFPRYMCLFLLALTLTLGLLHLEYIKRMRKATDTLLIENFPKTIHPTVQNELKLRINIFMLLIISPSLLLGLRMLPWIFPN